MHFWKKTFQWKVNIFKKIKLPILLWSNLAGFGGTAGEAGFGATIGLFELNLGDPLIDPGPELGPGPGLEFGIGQDVCLKTGLPAIGGVFDCTGEELCLVRDWHFRKVSS